MGILESAFGCVSPFLASGWGVFSSLCVATVVFFFLYYIVGRFLVHCVITWFFPMPNFKRFGPWAVITGATDGIGKCYAEELAKQGLNIVLISRSEEKLRSVAGDLEKSSGVETRIVQADFTRTDIYERIREQVRDLDVGVLVNNVGHTYRYPEYFNDIPDGDRFCMDVINCNVTSTVMMTRAVLPGMERRGRGLVVNVGSNTALLPFPLLTVYAAAKIFVSQFSLSLEYEYRRKGLVIQMTVPGYVATKMAGRCKPTIYTPSPEAWVRGQLRTVGWFKVTGGYWFHDLLLVIYDAGRFFAREFFTFRAFAYVHQFRVRHLSRQQFNGRKQD